jgi:hypothetical protein
VFRVLKIKDPDGIRSLWGFCTENPDDPAPTRRSQNRRLVLGLDI